MGRKPELKMRKGKLSICLIALIVLLTVGYLWGMSDGTLDNPTSKELANFLRADGTSKIEYSDESYVCSHYVRDVIKNAKSKGIRCGIALIELELPIGHIVSVFETVDNGLVFIESTSDPDFQVYPEIGEAMTIQYRGKWVPVIVVDIIIIW